MLMPSIYLPVKRLSHEHSSSLPFQLRQVGLKQQPLCTLTLQPSLVHHATSRADNVAADRLFSSPFSPFSLMKLKLISQVLGLFVHFPEGQSEAPSAEHCPAQLTPLPQVATLKVLSGTGRQQVTLVVWLEKVKALSKKSTAGKIIMFPKKAPKNWYPTKAKILS